MALLHPSVVEAVPANTLRLPWWLPAVAEAIFRVVKGGRPPLGDALRPHYPPRPCSQSAEVLLEFVVWAAEPARTRLQLPRFLLGELPAGALGGLWLQADGCCG